jgi:hypothetical protein
MARKAESNLGGIPTGLSLHTSAGVFVKGSVSSRIENTAMNKRSRHGLRASTKTMTVSRKSRRRSSE